MSHTYLLDTYAYITRRLEAVRQYALSATDDPQAERSTAGRVEALSQFERYLSDNFDAKLPRRLARLRRSQK